MIEGDTIPRMLQARVKKSASRPAFRYKAQGEWRTLTWGDYGQAVREIAQALAARGVAKGERVAILCQTRPEWAFIDQAVLALGAVTVPIYPSNTAEQSRYILENSGACALFVEDKAQMENYQAVASRCPGVKTLVTLEAQAPAGALTLAAFREQGRDFARKNPGKFEATLSEVRPADTATIVYTSGTTGNPKGVVLTHGNLAGGIKSVTQVLSAGEDDTVLSFLPMAHIFARGESLWGIYMGWQAAFAESLDKIVENLGEISPTLIFSVPRIYERAYGKILAGVEGGSALKRALFNWSVGVGEKVSKLKQQGKAPAGLLALQFALANALIFKKVRAKLGMTRLRFAISGGAPLSRRIAEFFHVLGVQILEGYGLTETSGAATVNRLEHYQFGTVGQAIPGVEVKIAGDGEILLRGPSVFTGYYKDEEATKEVLTPEGWFHTGDIGRLDAEGFLAITDRKKDLIITSGGKNVSPQNIENLLKTHRHISQVMVYGDKRKYLTALITLNVEEVAQWARQAGVEGTSAAQLADHPKVIALVEEIVKEKNKQLASYESIKKFRIVAADFTVEGGELTPTLKVKRKVVTQKYKDLLDGLYDAGDRIE